MHPWGHMQERSEVGVWGVIPPLFPKSYVNE